MPDRASAEKHSNAEDPPESPPIPVVCFGLSAGGLHPLEVIMRRVSPTTGMAFVMPMAPQRSKGSGNKAGLRSFRTFDRPTSKTCHNRRSPPGLSITYYLRRPSPTQSSQSRRHIPIAATVRAAPKVYHNTYRTPCLPAENDPPSMQESAQVQAFFLRPGRSIMSLNQLCRFRLGWP